MSDQKPTYDQLEQEIQQLKDQLQAQQTAANSKEKAKRKSYRFVSSFAQRFLLGTQLTKELKNIKNKVFSGQIPNSDDWIDVSGAVFYRLTRIGIFAIIMALIPVSILIVQTLILNKQTQRIEQQTYLQEAERRSALVFLFSNVMDAIDDELKEDYGEDSIRNLSPQLIGRIVSLSQRLKPYRYLEDGKLIDKPLSPERGQLLVNLVESRLDTNTYLSIWTKASFENADLRKIQFDTTAYLKNINLRHANLKQASLSKTYLVDAKLDSITASDAYFVNANMQYASLNGANLNRSFLTDANLKYNNMYYISLYASDLIGADLSFSALGYANLRYANINMANLSRTDLNHVNLSNAELIGAKIDRTTFFRTKLDDVLVSKGFLSNTDKLKNEYVEQPLEQYQEKHHHITYLLEKEKYSVLIKK